MNYLVDNWCACPKSDTGIIPCSWVPQLAKWDTNKLCYGQFQLGSTEPIRTVSHMVRVYSVAIGFNILWSSIRESIWDWRWSRPFELVPLNSLPLDRRGRRRRCYARQLFIPFIELHKLTVPVNQTEPEQQIVLERLVTE